MSAFQLLETVNDQASFLLFVEALALESRSGVGWENASITDFLESASAWAKDSSFGQGNDLGTTSPWRLFASFLYAGKVYE
jgi:hypothetical protein